MSKLSFSIKMLLASCIISGSAYATANASLQTDLVKAGNPKNTESTGVLDNVYIVSSKHLNRIVTPFKNPSVKLDDLPDTTWQAKENVIYFASKLQGTEISGFITETGDENSSIPVIFKPMPVPPQQVVLKSSVGSSFGSQRARDFEQSNPRNTSIVKVMATLARGELPDGYTIGSPSSEYLPTQCHQDGLVFDFYSGQLASGGDYMVAIGTVTNISKHAVSYKVSNCFGNEGVIANSSYPFDVLAPNQTSEAFVMFYRNKPTARPKSARSSLLRNH